MGGMWGMKTKIDLKLSQNIFSMIMNKTLSIIYNQNGNSAKEADQDFLRDHVYRLIRKNSTIHDSYHCLRFADSQPFPTQRINDDHVGSYISNKTKIFPCPFECRPSEHKNWEFC